MRKRGSGRPEINNETEKKGGSKRAVTVAVLTVSVCCGRWRLTIRFQYKMHRNEETMTDNPRASRQALAKAKDKRFLRRSRSYSLMAAVLDYQTEVKDTWNCEDYRDGTFNHSVRFSALFALRGDELRVFVDST
jgi:hypothetical protein